MMRKVPVLPLCLLATAFADDPARAATFGELATGTRAYGAQPMPGNTMPGNTMPGNTMPGNAMPGNAMPGNALPGNAAGPYALAPGYCTGDCRPVPPGYGGGPEGTPPAEPNYQQNPYVPPVADTPRAYLPFGPNGGQPHDQMLLWSFGQINATTDPFDPWGLRTPFMTVPWSTPLSGWTNAQTWNWWR